MPTLFTRSMATLLSLSMLISSIALAVPRSCSASLCAANQCKCPSCPTPTSSCCSEKANGSQACCKSKARQKLCPCQQRPAPEMPLPKSSTSCQSLDLAGSSSPVELLSSPWLIHRACTSSSHSFHSSYPSLSVLFCTWLT